MKTGSLEGFVDRTWAVVHDSGELAAAVTSYTISGLDGNTDIRYRLISRVVNGYNGASDYLLRFNADSGNNYGRQYVLGTGSTASAARNTPLSAVTSFANNAALGNISLTDMNVFAKSGAVRTLISKHIFSVSGTTVTYIMLQGHSWNNTADNLITMTIASDTSGGIGIGSRFILLKEVHVPSGLRTGELDIRGTLKGAWQEVYRHTVAGSAETSITVSGLLGNTKDQILRVRVRWVNANNSDEGFYIRLNGDGGTNCGYQLVYGQNASALAARGTLTSMYAGSGVALNNINHTEMLLYLKSGFVRTGISEVINGISGTTIINAMLAGSSWNNTADEITHIDILSNHTGAIGIGSEFVIERLNL